MSQGTTFRIFAVNNRDSKKLYLSREVHDRYVEYQLHSGTYWPTDKDVKEKIEEAIQQEGYAPFVRVFNEPTEEEKKYNSLGSQKEDPFPIWIDTSSNKEAYEIYNEDFMSNFNELYQYLGITGNKATECKEITRKQAKDILAVVNYILAGKYDRDIEETVFEYNEFFHVFEEQYLNFAHRFKKAKKQSSNLPTIRIVIKDERTNVEQENYEFGDDDEESFESKKEMLAELNKLRSVLETFLNISYRCLWKKEEEINVIYKLAYFKWY